MNKIEQLKELLGLLDEQPNIRQDASSPVSHGKYIVIFQRGWIAIGDLSTRGDMCYLTNASYIRRWGTTAGLGQLALEGRQAETVLDYAGTIEYHQLTEVHRIKVEAKWSTK